MFYSQFKSKVGNILDKTTVLRINLNIDGVPISSRSHTHPSHSQTSRLLTLSLSLGVPVPRGTQCWSGETFRSLSSSLLFSLSLHRHLFIVCILFRSRFIYYNKHKKVLQTRNWHEQRVANTSSQVLTVTHRYSFCVETWCHWPRPKHVHVWTSKKKWCPRDTGVQVKNNNRENNVEPVVTHLTIIPSWITSLMWYNQFRWENRPTNSPSDRDIGLEMTCSLITTCCGSKSLKVILIDCDLDLTLSWIPLSHFNWPRFPGRIFLKVKPSVST